MALSRPGVLFGSAAVIAVLGFQLWVSPATPGFHHDESAFALNGYTIGHSLRDQDGALLPLFFPSYGDYKSALFSYVLAAPILVLGPSNGVARWTAAVFGVLAVVAVGLVAYRRAGPWFAVGAGCLAGLTPWLFQLTRVAYDTSMYPLAIALVALAVEIWATSSRRVVPAAAVAVALAYLTYGYAAGRVLGPLLAVALVIFAGRARVREIAYAWSAYLLLLVPLIAYRIRHPHGLTARYHQTTFVTPDLSWWEIVRHFLGNYVQDVSPFHWVYAGDPTPYIDVAGTPELLGASVAVAIVGVVETLRRRDRFWLYVLVGYFLAPVPAAVTVDRHDALRLSALPVFIALLCIPGMQVVLRQRRPVALVVGVVLAAAAVGQWGHFVDVYSAKGRSTRTVLFDSNVPALLQRGFSGGQTVYFDHDDAYAKTVAGWYAVSHDLPLSRTVRLPDGGVPPNGAMVFGRTQDCDYVCNRVAEADSFWVAVASVPASTG